MQTISQQFCQAISHASISDFPTDTLNFLGYHDVTVL